MKKIIVLLILIAMTFSFNAQSQRKDQNSLGSLSKNRQDARASAPDSSDFLGNVFGGDETLSIPQIDEEVGIQLDAYTTDQDKAKASLGYMLSSNLRDAASLSGLEFTYSHKLKKVWLEGYLSQTSAKTKRLTDYNSKLGTPSAELLEENSDVTQFGLGAMYRTTYIQNLIPSARFFETISAMATYNQFNDAVSEQSFSGYGLKADLGVHRRISPAWHIGAKLSYNLATVKREAQFEEEKPNKRSLLLRWVSVGLEFSVYF